MDREPILFDFEEVSHNWRRFLFLSIVLILLGGAGLAMAWLPTIASSQALGVFLVAGGVMEVLAARWGRHSSGLLLRALVGVFHAFVGILLISYPKASLTAMTMLLAWLFLASGLVRTAIGGILRYPSWGWAALESVAAIVLAVVIWSNWPGSSLWIVGMFVGIALIGRGWAWAMFAIGVRPATAEDTFFGYARNFW